MPLSSPVEREHLHTRKVTCRGYKRKDGLWDIEASLEDTKTFGFTNSYRGGRVEAGEPVHGMHLRLTLDLDFKIHGIEAASDFTPYAICPNAVEPMKRIIGLSIRPGWMRDVRKAVGRSEGCTHLLELLPHIGTVAFQTMYMALEERESNKEQQGKPRIIDSCVAYASDGDLVKKRWPDFFKGDKNQKQ